MKQIAIALLSAAVASATNHHAHQHLHQAKRDPTPVEVVNVPGPTFVRRVCVPSPQVMTMVNTSAMIIGTRAKAGPTRGTICEGVTHDLNFAYILLV